MFLTLNEVIERYRARPAKASMIAAHRAALCARSSKSAFLLGSRLRSNAGERGPHDTYIGIWRQLFFVDRAPTNLKDLHRHRQLLLRDRVVHQPTNSAASFFVSSKR